MSTATHDLGAGALLTHEPGAITPSPDLVAAAFAAAARIPPTMTRFKQALLRRQGTYGLPYTFAGGNQHLGGLDGMPALFRACLDDARARASAGGHDPSRIQRCHVNFYTGKAWLAHHQDDETRGTPIYSYTFYRHPPPTCRLFTVSRDKAGKDVVAELAPQHGDLIVMDGAHFQQTLWHGCPKPTAARTHDRLNVTLRLC